MSLAPAILWTLLSAINKLIALANECHDFSFTVPFAQEWPCCPCRTLKFCFRCAIGVRILSFSQPGNDRAMEAMEAIDHRDHFRSKRKVIVRLSTQFLWSRSIIIGLESGNWQLPITFENPGYTASVLPG